MGNYATIDSTMVASFRATMHAFESATDWPADIVEQALYEADAETGGAGWGGYEDLPRNFKRRGMFYFAAHWLSATYLSGSAADASAINPKARLNIAAKSVGDESVQYRITEMQDVGEDFLSLTLYGVEFFRLRKRAAMCARVV